MKRYIMVFDAGTTSCRTILFDRSGCEVCAAQKEFTQYYPQPGWVEHDPSEIWSTQMGTALEAMLKADASAADIAAIGITNQRETTVVWERETGMPVCPAIVWQCRRTADRCDALKKDAACPPIREITGLLPDPYFSATKLAWILDHHENLRERAQTGKICFGTVDSWLLYKLTGGSVHRTDVSNASRTMLFNIHTLDWDDSLLRYFRIPREMMPQVCDSSCVFGASDPSLLGGVIPICGIAGDQQAALFGQLCFAPGSVKNTYGTGAFLLMNTGTQPVRSHKGLLTTVAWRIDGIPTYALEGSVFVAGAVVQWLRDEMGLLRTAEESEELALSVPDTNGAYFVPAFTGLGAPYWDAYARGTIVGLTRGVNRKHVVRAALEAIAYQTEKVLSAMREDACVNMSALKADGGASANRFLMQFQADILQMEVRRPKSVETTARGAAYLAGLGCGFFSSLQDLESLALPEDIFSPTMAQEDVQIRLDGWDRAVRRAKNWAR